MSTKHTLPQGLKFWGPALAWTGLVILGSSNLMSTGQTGGLLEGLILSLKLPLGSEDIELIHHILRKLGHFSVYAILGWLWDRALERDLPRYSYLLAWLICLGMASWDEWHQSLLSDRSGTLPDVALDLLGSSLALLVRGLFKKR